MICAEPSVSDAIRLWRSGRRQEAEAICERVAGRQQPTDTPEQLAQQAQAPDMLAEIQCGSDRRHEELAGCARH